MRINLEDLLSKSPGSVQAQVRKGVQMVEDEARTFITFGEEKIDENKLNLLKEIWVTDLLPYRQTSCVNFRGMIDSFRAQGTDISEDIFSGLKEYDPRYSKTYLMDISNWTDLGAFIRMQEIVKEKTGNPNPRQFMQHGLYSGLMKSYFQIVDLKLRMGPVRSVYELLPEETRNANYDLIMQYVRTWKEEGRLASRFIMKYFDNFRKDIPIDHKWWVISIMSGLAKRKKRSFAEPEIHYFEEDLETVLARDYAYMGWEIARDKEGNVTVGGAAVSRRAVFRKAVERCTMHPLSRIWSKFSFISEREIYAPSPIDPSPAELREGLASGDLVYGDLVIETRTDLHDYIIKSGEVYGMPITLADYRYEKKRSKNIDGFSETEQEKKSFAEWLTGIGDKEEARARQQILVRDALRSAEIARIAEGNERNLREHLEDLVEERTAELKEALIAKEHAQAQLIQDEKLKSLGKLTAGVSHEINNPMTSVKSGIEQLIVELKNKDQVYLDLQDYFISKNIKISCVEQVKRLGQMKYQQSQKNQRLSSIDVRKRKKELVPILEGIVENSEAYARDFVRMGIDPVFLATIMKMYENETIPYIFSCIKTEYQLGAILNTLTTSTNRVLEVTTALKRHTHLDQGKIGKVDIIESIEDTLTILQNSMKEKNISLEKNYFDTPIIEGYPTEIGDVWMNLIYNSYQAVEQNGYIHISVREDPELIYVQVKDNGRGISAENLGKIFDPFFTTKDQGEGSGLGLYNCKSAVERHGGKIEVLSKEGETIFEVKLSKKIDYNRNI